MSDFTTALPVKGNGTAGTADANVVTVQGIASMTPLLVTATLTSTTITGTVTVDSELPAAAALADATANPTVPAVGAFGMAFNGTTWDRMRNGHGTAAAAVRVELPTDGTGAIDKILTSIVPGTAATNLGKAEDAAHASGDTGVFVLAVKSASGLDSRTATDANYAPFAVDANGRVWVGGCIDGAAWTAGSSKLMPMAAIFDDVSPAAATENNFGIPRMSVRKEQYVQIRDAAGNERGLNVDASGRIATTTSFASGADAAAVNTYGTKASLAPAAATTTEIQYTVAGSGTAAKFAIKGFSASSSGRIKVRVLGGTTAGILTADKATFFNSTANPNIAITFPQQIEVPTTSTGIVRLEITNMEPVLAPDVYGTIFGAEV